MIKIDIKKQFTIITFFSAILFCTTSCQFFFGKNPELKEIRLRDAIRIHPNHELGYIRLAQYLEKLHRYSETLFVLRLGQKQIPNSITLVRLEGGILQGLGNQKESAKFYAKQIRKYPNNPFFYLDRARLRWNMNKKNLALADARMALKINPDSFEALYLIGIILSHKSDQNTPEKIDKALEILFLASEINSNNPDLWLRISTLWEKKKNIRMARIAMIRAVELSPESETYLRRLTLLLEKELNEKVSDNYNNISKSLRNTLLHILKLFPKNSWGHAHYGNWAWTQEKFSLAEKHLKDALRLKPDYPWANFRLAVVYISQNKWESALLYLEKGLKYESKNEWGLEKIGVALEMLGRNKEAIHHYERLMKNAPIKLTLVNRLSNLYWKEFLFKKRENILLLGLKNFPLESSLIEKLVNYYESHSLYENAVNILSSFTKLEPNNSTVLAKIGFFENKLNRPKKALKFFEKALTVAPDFEWAQIQLIEILLKTKKNERAEKNLIKFLKSKPDSEWALLQLSILKIEKEQFQLAENLLNKNLLKSKDSIIILHTLSRLYKIQKRWEEAEEISQKMLNFKPNNSSILTNLAFIQWKLNKTELARVNINKALYENTRNLLAWNIHFILQTQLEQHRWIGKDLSIVLPILENLANQDSLKTWEGIKSMRTDPFTRQIMKNLHYLFEGFPEEIILDPEDMTSKQLSPWIHERWGYFHEILENRELAVKHIELASENLPNNSWIHARLGWLYEILKKPEKSLHHYSKFLKKHPEAFEINFRLANVHLLLGNEASTIDIYEKIISDRPDNDLVLNNLAWLLLTAKDRKLRNINKGLDLALKSVEIFPTIDNLDTLAEAYFQLGKIKKAIQIIRKASREINYPINRQSYLRKQLLRFRNGKQNTNPPTLY